LITGKITTGKHQGSIKDLVVFSTALMQKYSAVSRLPLFPLRSNKTIAVLLNNLLSIQIVE